MDADYLMLVGEVIYLYDMFECTVVEIIDSYRHGFREGFFFTHRHSPGQILKLFNEVRKEEAKDNSKVLEDISKGFLQAMDIRNAVSHGHPITDKHDLIVPDRQVLSCHAGDFFPGSKKRKPTDNRYDDVSLTYEVLLQACRELESGCAKARYFLDFRRKSLAYE